MFAELLTLKEYAVKFPGKVASSEDGNSPLFSEPLFAKLLFLERKRAERSRKPFALMLVDAGKLLRRERRDIMFARLAVALSLSTRETDIWGWYKEGAVIGVILTELGSAPITDLHNTIVPKVSSALRTKFGPGEIEKIRISLHVFPGVDGPIRPETLEQTPGGVSYVPGTLHPLPNKHDRLVSLESLVKRLVHRETV